MSLLENTSLKLVELKDLKILLTPLGSRFLNYHRKKYASLEIYIADKKTQQTATLDNDLLQLEFARVKTLK